MSIEEVCRHIPESNALAGVPANEKNHQQNQR